jgi:SAM-dependent methyltransferase
MASVEQHYDRVLADVYSWMSGGFEAAIRRNADFFEHHAILPAGSRRAVDLGAGCGFQSIPLARRGYRVVALDLDRKLLDELIAHAGELPIDTIQDDLANFTAYVDGHIELAVCMVDTLLHLASRERVCELFASIVGALEPGGALVITFRDLSRELVELDRFIPVRNDVGTILTCYLEYEPDTVKVHDLVYRRRGDAWTFDKSFYRKLRLAPQWVVDRLHDAGFSHVQSDIDAGLVTIIARKAQLLPGSLDRIP